MIFLWNNKKIFAMKFIYKLMLLLMLFISFSGCEEKEWTSDDLTLTDVVKVVISNEPFETYWFYTKNKAVIHNFGIESKLYKSVDFKDRSNENIIEFSCDINTEQNNKMKLTLYYDTNNTLLSYLQLEEFSENQMIKQKKKSVVELIKTQEYTIK